MDTTIFAVLACALLSVSVGVAKLASWLIDRREAGRARAIREATIVAQARTELASAVCSPSHETLYQAEIAATKRGDLLTAAYYAEQRTRAEVSHV